MAMPSKLESADPVERLRAGGATELSSQFAAATGMLEGMIALRIGPLRQRLDVCDVIQDTFVEANRRLDEYLANPVLPPRIWLRKIGRHVLSRLFRTHLDTQKRAMALEHNLASVLGAPTDISAASRDIAASISSPHSVLVREEIRVATQQILECLDPMDREVLCMRDIEDFTFREIAQELEISEQSARRRLFRAMQQFRKLSALVENLTR